MADIADVGAVQDLVGVGVEDGGADDGAAILQVDGKDDVDPAAIREPSWPGTYRYIPGG